MSAPISPFRAVTPQAPEARLRAFLADLAEEAPPEGLPALIGALAEAQAILWGRFLAGTGTGGRGQTPEGGDRLFTVEEAAQRLAVSEDWLYRHADKLPFTVRIGDRHLRFSAAGIEKFIRQKVGK